MGHCPVEEAVHPVDVHVEVLGRLSDEVDVPLTCSPPAPVRNVIPIETALVEQDDRDSYQSDISIQIFPHRDSHTDISIYRYFHTDI